MTLQARAGIARAAATRSGYFTQVVRCTIGGTLTNIHLDSLKIRDAGRTKTASFTLNGTAPTKGSLVNISIGSTGNLLFAGHVTSSQATFLRESTTLVLYAVECEGWTWALNLAKPIGYWTGTASSILASLLETWAPDFSLSIQVGLPDLGTVECFGDEGVCDVLDRITGLVTGGRWLVTDGKRIVIYTVGNLGLPQPAEVADGSKMLAPVLTVRDAIDRVANYVMVKSRSTQILNDVPTDDSIIPVENIEGFSTTGGHCLIGSQLFSYDGVIVGGAYCQSNPYDIDTPPGYGLLAVSDTSLWRDAPGGWAKTGNGWYMRYADRNGTSGTGAIIDGPTVGIGSLTGYVMAEEIIEVVSCIHGLAAVADASGSTQTRRQLFKGDTVTHVSIATDATAVSDLATLLGMQGIAQAVVINDGLSATEASQLAASLLAQLKSDDGLQDISGQSRDPNLWAGRTLTLDLSAPITVAGDFIVDDVEMFGFGQATYIPPPREFSASEFQPADPLAYIFATAPSGRMR